MNPKILVDTQEKESAIMNHLLVMTKTDKRYKKVEISAKSGGSADYVIVDKDGNHWGVERKTLGDCYSSIIQKDKDGKERAQAQLAELKADYNERAIFMLQVGGNVSKRIPTPIWIIKTAVFTFATRRSFLMPLILYENPKHGAYMLLDLAVKLPDITIEGRGVKITRKT